MRNMIVFCVFAMFSFEVFGASLSSENSKKIMSFTKDKEFSLLDKNGETLIRFIANQNNSTSNRNGYEEALHILNTNQKLSRWYSSVFQDIFHTKLKNDFDYLSIKSPRELAIVMQVYFAQISSETLDGLEFLYTNQDN